MQLSKDGDRGTKSTSPLTRKTEDDEAILSHLERRTLKKNFVSIGELRDILRRAAAIISRNNKDQCAIVHHLVSLPFAIFTKQAIKLGISLWLGIVNENPRLESIILAEIAENWENSVRNRMGVFSEKLLLVFQNAFYIRTSYILVVIPIHSTLKKNLLLLIKEFF